MSVLPIPAVIFLVFVFVVLLFIFFLCFWQVIGSPLKILIPAFSTWQMSRNNSGQSALVVQHPPPLPDHQQQGPPIFLMKATPSPQHNRLTPRDAIVRKEEILVLTPKKKGARRYKKPPSALVPRHPIIGSEDMRRSASMEMGLTPHLREEVREADHLSL